jgi:hypothetical protein
MRLILLTGGINSVLITAVDIPTLYLSSPASETLRQSGSPLFDKFDMFLPLSRLNLPLGQKFIQKALGAQRG